MSASKPFVGAALRSSELESMRDWLLEGPRDLEIQDFYSAERLDDWQPIVAHIQRHLDGYTGRLGVHGPNPSVTYAPNDPKVADLVRERFLQGLDVCEALGATQMVIHSPFVFLGNPFLPHVERMGQDWRFERAYHTLQDVVRRAEGIGCTLVIENVWDKAPGLLLDLVREHNSDSVRLSVDVGHAYIAHIAGGPPPDHWILEAGDLLAHLHLQDTDGYGDRHWLPGNGAIHWDAIFRAIARLKHQPRLILELQDRRFLQAADWLQSKGWVL
jgi:sugar phosphate isomerase/epimerase